jgi:selenocysteine-specific elongation factor
MRSVIVGTAGHIDHGKSALVRALTGTDPDRLKEEKARGITIDLGFAHLTVEDLNFSFVDVPGHERFVKNMLAGVGGIDLVVLVVAADESVMPQTREHFDICRLLRVPSGVVALSKADLVDEDTLDLVRLEVAELTAGSLLAGAPVVPVSSRTGQGLDELRAALVRVASNVHQRSTEGPTRLPIDRVFSMRGFGTVVTGTLVSGCVRLEQDLLVVPGDRPVKVRGVQVHGVGRAKAVAGQRTAVNLGGVEVDELQRGQSLIETGSFPQTRIADAVLEVLPSAKPVKHSTRVRFHQGTSEILGRIALIGPADPESSESERQLAPGTSGYVRLRLEGPAVLARGDSFIIRAYSPARTIAGGHILDPIPPRVAIRSEAALERCRRVDFDPAADRLEGDVRASQVMIDEAGDTGLLSTELSARSGIGRQAMTARIDALMTRGTVAVDDVLVARGNLDGLKEKVLDALAQHHSEQPLSEGLGREEARVRLFRRGRSSVFDRAIDDLAAAGRIVGRDRLALPTHHVQLSDEAARSRDLIERAFRDGGLTPPDHPTLVSASGASAATVDQVLKLLLRQRVLVKVDTLMFHADVLQRLKSEVAAMKRVTSQAQATLDVPKFKERFGVTRKFAIPLLEYLDRERVTRRMGDVRLIL